jgi:LysM repeat protein
MMKKTAVFLAVSLMATQWVSAKVIGRVNGFPITEKQANAFLKVVTKGKLKYNQIRPKDKRDVIQRIAVDSLLIGLTKKEIPKQERDQVLVNYWLSKKIEKIEIDPAEVEKAYNENKNFFKGPDGKVLPLEQVRPAIIVSLKQKKYVAQLMEKATITMGKKVIKSPKKGKGKTSTKSKAKSSANGKTKTYVVKSGNTLSGIAHKYHITVKQLREMNGMSEKDVLKIGQKLKVPAQ